MHLDAVLFDLDGTLLDRRETFRRHLELQVRRQSHYFVQSDAREYIAELLRLDENGTCNRHTLYRETARRCNLPEGAAEALRADFKMWFPESCLAFPRITETLERLRDAGLKLGVITHGSVKIQTRKIERLGIGRLLDCVLVSEAVGVSKPDPAIFGYALGELGTSAAATMFVGDNPEPDVRGAKRSGLYAVWKRDSFWEEPCEADLVIDEVADLPQHIPNLVKRPSA